MSVEGLMLDLGMNLESKERTTMQYVYVVFDPTTGFIYGVYADQADAQQVFDALAGDKPGLRLATEPVIRKPAHYKP